MLEIDMTTLKYILVVGLSVYLGIVAIMFFAQRALMYFPETVRTAPADAGLPQAQEVMLRSADGTEIIAWQVPPKPGKPVLVYFHGNGGALQHRVPRFLPLIADGTGLVALSYRGYGGSKGSPSETGLIEDGQAAFDFARRQYPDSKLVLWGESLGTGVATAIASHNDVAAVVLEAPYTSTADIAFAAYPFIPVGLLMKDQFRSDERIGKVRAPLLILHGAKDRVIPIAFGERLFALANEPKHFVRFARGEHENLGQFGAVQAAKDFLAKFNL
jgi:fermentation-respiration switch protein FrsA (DUF1100 family)